MKFKEKDAYKKIKLHKEDLNHKIQRKTNGKKITNNTV